METRKGGEEEIVPLGRASSKRKPVHTTLLGLDLLAAAPSAATISIVRGLDVHFDTLLCLEEAATIQPCRRKLQGFCNSSFIACSTHAFPDRTFQSFRVTNNVEERLLVTYIYF